MAIAPWFKFIDTIDKPTTKGAIENIVRLNTKIAEFWANSHGWAPSIAAALLAEADLRLQVELSHVLRRLVRKPPPEMQRAHLVQAWAVLGAMVESTLKFFLAVYHEDYSKHFATVKATAKHSSPDELMLEKLKVFFNGIVWVDCEKKRWFGFVDLVQKRRNAIHAFMPRELGTLKEFRAAVREYSAFLDEHEGRVPYPY